MSVTLHWRAPEDLDAAALQAWSRLGQTGEAAPNPFAMPEFVLPASRWLTPRHPPRLAWIERGGAGTAELIGVGVFRRCAANLFVPMPHLRDYRTPYSFRSGMLIVPGEADSVADALYEAARAAPLRTRAFDFRNLPADCPVFARLRARAQAQGGGWHPRRQSERPVLRLHDAEQACIAVPAPSKDLRRRLRRLQSQGALEFRLLHGDTADAQAVRTHLQLEHAGWKGQGGSALLSSPGTAAFFREMVQGFARIGAAVFMETRLDGRCIASSSNLWLGDTLNAFKIGWDPAFAACSPGRVNEYALCQAMRTQLPSLACFDSQAQEDSYLADLLPHRQTLLTGTLALDARAARFLRLARAIRPFAYRIADPD